MLSLSIFSSSQRMSIALYKDKMLEEFYEKDLDGVKMDAIFLLLKKIFKNRRIKIEQIFYSIGPGSFTSIRSIKAIAEGISNILCSKIINVSEFDIYLSNLENQNKDVLVFYNSFNKNFFYKRFRLINNKYKSISNLLVGELEEIVKYIDKNNKSFKDLKLISNSKKNFFFFNNFSKDQTLVCHPCARKLANAVFLGYGKKHQKIVYHHTYYVK